MAMQTLSRRAQLLRGWGRQIWNRLKARARELCARSGNSMSPWAEPFGTVTLATEVTLYLYQHFDVLLAGTAAAS